MCPYPWNNKMLVLKCAWDARGFFSGFSDHYLNLWWVKQIKISSFYNNNVFIFGWNWISRFSFCIPLTAGPFSRMLAFQSSFYIDNLQWWLLCRLRGPRDSKRTFNNFVYQGFTSQTRSEEADRFACICTTVWTSLIRSQSDGKLLNV